MSKPIRMSMPTRLNWLIDAVVVVGGILAGLSGIYFLYLPSGGYQGGRNPMYGVTILFGRHTWEDVHLWGGVLMMAAIDAGDLGLYLETVSVAGLLRYCQKNVWRSEAAGALVVELPDPPNLMVCVDQRYIRIVLSHLLDNALKFSPPGSPVQVRAEVRGDGVAITVIDQGVGIAVADLERIFERFHQMDMSSTRAYEGLGCGLYLVRALVEVHGGYVKVGSEVGVGSQFTVWLPREMPEDSYQVEDMPRVDDRGEHG